MGLYLTASHKLISKHEPPLIHIQRKSYYTNFHYGRENCCPISSLPHPFSPLSSFIITQNKYKHSWAMKIKLVKTGQLGKIIFFKVKFSPSKVTSFMQILNIYRDTPNKYMIFMPKHGHCLGKRRKWMLYFLFCSNPSFTKGKKAPILKWPLHRKQFSFKRRVWFGSFDRFSAPRFLFILLYQFHSLRLVKIKSKDIVLVQSVRRPTLLLWDSIILLHLAHLARSGG